MVTPKEKKDKRKSLLIALLMLSGIVALSLFPMVTRAIQEIEEEPFTMIVDYRDFTPASKEGAKPKTTKKAAEAKQKTKKVTPKPTPRPAPKPVLTTPDPEPQIPTQPDPVPEPEPVKVEIPVDAPEAPAPEAEEASTETTEKTASETASGSGKGSKNNGDSHIGTTPGDRPGDGIFDRRVIFRPEIQKITKEEGKIVVNICINQDGRVVYVKPDKSNTTITDMDNVRKAVEMTTQYKFERDVSAPYKQCGKMTYIFKID